MKFSDLKIGQPFIYKGVELEKSGPLQAVEKATGTTKSIMRAAAVELLYAHSTDQSTRSVCLNDLKQALTSYHQTCLSLVQSHGNQQEEVKMERAYAEILQLVDSLSETDR